MYGAVPPAGVAVTVDVVTGSPVLASLKAFTLVNLDASWKLTRTTELYGRVENLFDQGYQEVFSFQGAGRAAYAGVRVRF